MFLYKLENSSNLQITSQIIRTSWFISFVKTFRNSITDHSTGYMIRGHLNVPFSKTSNENKESVRDREMIQF